MSYRERVIAILFFIQLVLFIAYIINSKRTPKKEELKGNEGLPYRKKDELLRSSSRAFYEQLTTYFEGKAVVCPNVSLGSIVYVAKKSGKEFNKYNKMLENKYFDFVICNQSMNPLGAVCLDDVSQVNVQRYYEEALFKRICEAAYLPILRLPIKNDYTPDDFEAIELLFAQRTSINTAHWEDHGIAPVCPKCGKEMLKNILTSENEEESYYSCPNYPRCREKKEIVKRVPLTL